MNKLLHILVLTLGMTFGHVCAQNITIATGGTGGVYYPMGNGLASVLSSKMPGMSATAQVTGGSVDNLSLIGTDKPYIGFSMADAAKEALVGEDRFSGNRVDLKALLVMHPNFMHVVTIDSTGIKNIGDLRGRRVSTGSPGSATEVMALRLLEAAGIDPQGGVIRERLSVVESVNAIRDRKIDAFFWLGGLPTAAIIDLANTPGARMVMLDSTAEISAMNRKHGNLYFPVAIPKGTYTGMAKDNNVAAIANILAVNSNMPDDQAYKIVKTIFENHLDLIRSHAEFRNVKLEHQKSNAIPLAFHPGVVRYLIEKNIVNYEKPTIAQNNPNLPIANKPIAQNDSVSNYQQSINLTTPATSLNQGRRIALVIGNSSYKIRPLLNPRNDADDVSKVLRSTGFEVIDLRDATLAQMRASVRQFGERLMSHDVGLAYYAGHGIEVKGKNYFIPVNADIKSSDEVADQALDVSLILAKMDTAKKGVNILIVDACRDDPFGRSYRSSSRGLATMDAPQGTMIAYATAPGNVAIDGTGRNSPFTKHLVRAMQVPNTPIELMFKEVRRAVREETKNQQTPWENSSLIGNFYFSVKK